MRIIDWSILKKEEVMSFLLPKLTDEELKLVQVKDYDHLATYSRGFFADVDTKEMKKSASKDKYLLCGCCEKTEPCDTFLQKRIKQ